MPSGTVRAIPTRPLPGSSRAVSEIAIGIDPSMSGAPALDERLIAQLRRCRDVGVTLFDVADARLPARAERLLAHAFPDPDPELSVIVGRSLDALSRDSARNAVPPSETPAATFRDSVEKSEQRLAPLPISIVEWREPAESLPPLSGTEATWSPGSADLNGVICATRRDSPVGPSLSSRETPLCSVELSLLDTEEARRWTHLRSGDPPFLIARNPFADGRLDGSRFSNSFGPAAPGVGPIEVRRMHTEFDPVLRLGFLTEGRRRTLAQAALAFVTGWAQVVTTVVPLPAPERLAEVLDYRSAGSLTETELSRLGLVK